METFLRCGDRTTMLKQKNSFSVHGKYVWIDHVIVNCTIANKFSLNLKQNKTNLYER